MPDFTLFTLVIDSMTLNEYGDGPTYAEVTMTPDFLREIVNMAQTGKEKGFSALHKSWDDSVWEDSDESLRMRGTDLVVMPGSGDLRWASFFFQAHPKHADYNCESRAIDIGDLLGCIGHADVPSGFKRHNEVLFYDGNADTTQDLIDAFEKDNQEDGADEADGAPTPTQGAWVIYHSGQPNGERFWCTETGWTNHAGATRFDAMPPARYPLGGPELTQAGALCIGTMREYTVTMAASPMATACVFECFAEDENHAVEQAENAYPDDQVQSVCLTEDLES